MLTMCKKMILFCVFFIVYGVSLCYTEEKGGWNMKIALQLYTMRKFMSGDELDATLAKIKKTGYDYVETAGYAGLTPGEFKKHLDAAGLRAVSAHIGYDNFRDLDKLKEELASLDIKECAIPSFNRFYFPESAAGFTSLAEKMEGFALSLGESGIGLSYHNHKEEFSLHGPACGEQYIFNTARSLGFQLDCGHCRAAGEEPSEWIRRYGDRIYSIHAKDVNFDKDGMRYDTPIGDGLVDWDKVFGELVKTSCECIIVEHETMPGDMYEHIEKSYKFLSEKIKKYYN